VIRITSKIQSTVLWATPRPLLQNVHQNPFITFELFKRHTKSQNSLISFLRLRWTLHRPGSVEFHSLANIILSIGQTLGYSDDTTEAYWDLSGFAYLYYFYLFLVGLPTDHSFHAAISVQCLSSLITLVLKKDFRAVVEHTGTNSLNQCFRKLWVSYCHCDLFLLFTVFCQIAILWQLLLPPCLVSSFAIHDFISFSGNTTSVMSHNTDSFLKAPFIATQLNSTQLDVELSWVAS